MVDCTPCVSRTSISLTCVAGSRCSRTKLLHSGRTMKIILSSLTDRYKNERANIERVGTRQRNVDMADGRHSLTDSCPPRPASTRLVSEQAVDLETRVHECQAREPVPDKGARCASSSLARRRKPSPHNS